MNDREKAVVQRILDELGVCMDSTCARRPLDSAVSDLRSLLIDPEEPGLFDAKKESGI